MTTVTLLLSLALVGQSPNGTNMLTPPGKKSATCGWLQFDGREVSSPSLPGEKVFLFRGSPYGMTGAIEGFVVTHVPTARRMTLSLALRGAEAGQTFALSAVGMNPKAMADPKTQDAAASPRDKSILRSLSTLTAEWSETGSLRPDRWSRLRYVFSVPPGTKRLSVMLHNPNKGAIYMSAPVLESGPPMAPDPAAIAKARAEVATFLQALGHPFVSPAQQAADAVARHAGPVLAHLQIRVPVRTNRAGETGHVTFPVPGLCPGQVPLAFRVSESNGKVLGFRWRERPDKRNWVCEVDVKPGTKGVFVSYDALVLLGGPQSRDRTAPPKDADWTSSTACVQVSSPEIRQIAKRLAAPGDTDEAYARKVYAFVRDDTGKGAPFKSLDALAAVRSGGSCTNKANLVAALLRAHGMVARTVCHMPTWCSEPLDYHWLTEYWQAGKGWVVVDSALGRWEPDRRSRMVLAVASRSDEDRSFEPLHERFVMPGAPYQSVAELSRELYPADITQEDALNSGDQVTCFAMTPDQEALLFKRATASYQRMLRGLEAGENDPARYGRVLRAAKAGKL